MPTADAVAISSCPDEGTPIETAPGWVTSAGRSEEPSDAPDASRETWGVHDG